MISLRFSDLAAVTGGTLYNTDQAARLFSGVSIDSRSIKPGELFVALRGSRVDGHDYIDQAIRNGAAGIVTERHNPRLEQIGGTIPVVAVTNSHRAMLRLARAYRDSMDGRVIGITGSNGKTTTKELAYHLIHAVEPSVYRSPGNFNNLFGLPLSLMSISRTTRVVILEMGISTPGEMRQLTKLVQPDLVLLTNVSESHLEFLGTVEDVARAKLDLVRYSEPDIPVIVNADDPVLLAELQKVCNHYITFALDRDANFRVNAIEPQPDGTTEVNIDGAEFRLPLPGRHQVYNLLAAFAVARTLGYHFNGVDTRRIELSTAPMRGQRTTIGGFEVTADCYNANPASMRIGINTFFERHDGRRSVLVLGDMLELGPESPDYHKAIAEYLVALPFDLVIGVGPMMKHLIDGLASRGVHSAKLHHVSGVHELLPDFGSFLHGEDRIYLKGSRGMNLEKLLDVVRTQEEVH